MAQPDPMEVHEVQQSIAQSLATISGELSKIAKSLHRHNEQMEAHATAKKQQKK